MQSDLGLLSQEASLIYNLPKKSIIAYLKDKQNKPISSHHNYDPIIFIRMKYNIFDVVVGQTQILSIYDNIVDDKRLEHHKLNIN